MSIPAYLVEASASVLRFLRSRPGGWASTTTLRHALKTSDTAGTRRLLVRLERAGAIEADRSCANITRWRVTPHA